MRKMIMLLLVASLALVPAQMRAQPFLASETPSFQLFGQAQLIAQAFDGTNPVQGTSIRFFGTLPWGDQLYAGPVVTDSNGIADLEFSFWQPHVYLVQADGQIDFTSVFSTGRVVTIFSLTLPQLALGKCLRSSDDPSSPYEVSAGLMFQSKKGYPSDRHGVGQPVRGPCPRTAAYGYRVGGKSYMDFFNRFQDRHREL